MVLSQEWAKWAEGQPESFPLTVPIISVTADVIVSYGCSFTVKAFNRLNTSYLLL